MSDSIDDVGTESLSQEEKEEIVEDRYFDLRIAHYVGMFCMTVGLTAFLFFVSPEKITAFSGISFSVVIYFSLLSLLHLAKGIAGKVVDKFSK